jgi:hypothetical protein
VSTSALVQSTEQSGAGHAERVALLVGGDSMELNHAGRGGVDGIIMATGRGEGMILTLVGLVGAVGGCSIMMSAAAPTAMAGSLAGLGVAAALVAVGLLFWILKR